MKVIESVPTMSLTKIMYATDLSPIAERAGEYARAIALRFGSEVQIVHVLPSYDDGLRTVDRDDRHRSEARLISHQSELRAAGVKSGYSLSRDCPVGDALLLREMEFGPDLIVVGTESKSNLDRFLLGSTAEHLIRKARSPVITVGPNAKVPKEDPHLFQTILFATDFSEASNRAGRLALGVAHNTGAHLWICHIKTANILTDDARKSEHLSEQAFRDQLAHLIPAEAYDWWTPECGAEGGSAARGILHAAQTAGADLIVMGARARSFWLMHIHRGVTQDVLAGAPCPVLTVH